MIYILGYLWAAPTSLIGALVALLTLSRPLRIHQGAVICRAGGLMRLLFERYGFGAQTQGAVIFVLAGYENDEGLLRHELVHFAQARVWGPFFLPAYGLASLWMLLSGRDAYRDNPFEVHARKHSENT